MGRVHKKIGNWKQKKSNFNIASKNLKNLCLSGDNEGLLLGFQRLMTSALIHEEKAQISLWNKKARIYVWMHVSWNLISSLRILEFHSFFLFFYFKCRLLGRDKTSTYIYSLYNICIYVHICVLVLSLQLGLSKEDLNRLIFSQYTFF